jgi:hypothetical protein
MGMVRECQCQRAYDNILKDVRLSLCVREAKESDIVIFFT